MRCILNKKNNLSVNKHCPIPLRFIYHFKIRAKYMIFYSFTKTIGLLIFIPLLHYNYMRKSIIFVSLNLQVQVPGIVN
jgi:hypothetical protein